MLVDSNNVLVAPGTAGATGVTIQLFNDDGANVGVFESDDSLEGTVVSDVTTGRYAFDRLSVGDYFVVQDDVDGLNVPAAQLVQVTEADGEQSQLIDGFTDATSNIFTNDSVDPPTEATQTGLTGAVGGERNSQLDADTGVLTFSIATTDDTLSIGPSASGTGTALVQYDGVDGDITLAPNGLGGVDLLAGAETDASLDSAGIILLVRGEVAGATFDLTLHSGTGNSSTIAVDIDPEVSPNFNEVFVPFSRFVDAADATIVGSGVDLNAVGAIEGVVEIQQADNDVVTSVLESRISDVFTANLDNILPLTLSGTLFIDVSQTGTNNAVQDNNEPNFTNAVTVQLFADDGTAFDEANDVPIATTTTNSVGDYVFTDLAPGDYRVLIPSNQFTDNRNNAAANGVLFGFTSSLEDADAPDPDDDVDLDDNGELLASGAIISDPITLQSRTEPTDDETVTIGGDDTPDDSTNTTLDFGLLPQIDLSINKTVRSNSNITPGGTAVFRFSVLNVGPLDATGVTVVDTLPAGLTFNQLQNNGNFTATQNGQDITIVLGDLAARDVNGNGGIIEFDLVADIDAGQTTDVINSVVVNTDEQFDINLDNNDDDVDVEFISTDLRILKESITDPVVAGDTLVYRITVTNDGPDDASGVFVTDTLPDNVSFVSGNVQLPGEDGSVDNSALVVQDPADVNNPRARRINIGALANGESAIITLTTDVNSDSVDTVVNPARVNLEPDTDPNDANDTSTVTDPVVRKRRFGHHQNVHPDRQHDRGGRRHGPICFDDRQQRSRCGSRRQRR